MKLRYYFVFVATFALFYRILSNLIWYLPFPTRSMGVDFIVAVFLLVTVFILSKMATEWALERPLPKRQGTV